MTQCVFKKLYLLTLWPDILSPKVLIWFLNFIDFPICGHPGWSECGKGLHWNCYCWRTTSGNHKKPLVSECGVRDGRMKRERKKRYGWGVCRQGRFWSRACKVQTGGYFWGYRLPACQWVCEGWLTHCSLHWCSGWCCYPPERRFPLPID